MEYFMMKDDQSGKIKFVGNEEECIAFSQENPSCNYEMNKIDKGDLYKYSKYMKKPEEDLIVVPEFI